MPDLVRGAVPTTGPRLRAGVLRRSRALWAYLMSPRLRAGGAMPILGRDVRVSIQAGGTFTRGQKIILSDGVRVYTQGVLQMGTGTYVGRGSQISVFDCVTIGRNVRLGERVSVHDENHVFEPFPVPEALRNSYTTRPITIGDRVWIGANAVILPGATIGDDTVISAGAVVRGCIPGGVLAAGIPAQVIRELKNGDGLHD